MKFPDDTRRAYSAQRLNKAYYCAKRCSENVLHSKRVSGHGGGRDDWPPASSRASHSLDSPYLIYYKPHTLGYGPDPERMTEFHSLPTTPERHTSS